MRYIGISTVLLCAAGAIAQTAPPPADNTQPGDTLSKQVRRTIRTGGITNTALIAFLMAQGQASTPSVSRSINRLRTDLPSGTSSDSPRAASVAEKPGIPDLLSLAIDRGAITKTAAGTGLTLSTTPYAVTTGFGASDTPTLFDASRLARSLSISSTFSSTDVSNGDFSSFTSAELKYAAIGNRSPRDGRLLDSVRPAMADSFIAADQKLEEHCLPVMDNLTFRRAMDQINRAMLALGDKVTEDDVLRIVNSEVAKVVIDQVDLKPCFAAFPALQKALDAPLDMLRKATAEYLKNNPHQLSFAALFVRDAATSDYYTGKVLYAYSMANATASLNGSASWNRHDTTSAGLPLRSLREYSIETGANTPTRANVDYSASAKWSRDKAADAKSAIVGEAKAVVHIGDLYRLPLSLTFCNRDTEKLKKGWQFNFGLGALLDDVLRDLQKK